MPVFSAVDIGANSVRLRIARLERRRLRVLHEDREVTRLGESVFESGLLDPEAMAQTIKVLRRFHRAAQEFGGDSVRVVATSALRDARNAAAFIDWVRSATGWRVEIISGLEEGRLIHLGVLSGPKISARRWLLFDLGGGSCEVTLSRSGHIQYMTSLPLGAVRLTREFLRHDPPKPRELERLRGYVGKHLSRVSRHITGVQLTIATAGTAAALAARHQASYEGKRSRNKATTVTRKSLLEITEELSELTVKERNALAGIGTRRAEIIVAGAVVFSELLTRFRLPSFRYSPLGLRDGLLAQMAADYDRRTSPARQIETERWDALLAAGRHYRVDLKHAQNVRRSALDLFDALKRVHGLPAEYRDWLSAAAMLHEVGAYVNRANRHRHSHYIIANSEVFGYTPQQRALIAAIARYLGKSRPTAGDPAMRALAAADRQQVPKAVVLLRMAAAMNQGRRGIPARAWRAAVRDSRVLLELKKKVVGDGLELWALGKERPYFREVFGRELVAELS